MWLSQKEKGVDPFFAGKNRETRLKVKELIKALENDGWYLARTRGGHRQFRHPSKGGTVTVAGKPSVDVPPGTLSAILKQTGLKK